MFRKFLTGMALLVIPSLSLLAQPITYQGRLTGSAASTVDIQATLYSTTGGSTVVGTPDISDDVPISNNLFTTSFDFGSVDFNQPLFLELVVRDGVSTTPFTSLTPLSPRVPFSPVPLAYSSVNDLVDDADADPGNELIDEFVLNGLNLEISDAAGTSTVDLSSIQDGVTDADSDPTNEIQGIASVLGENSNAGGASVSGLGTVTASAFVGDGSGLTNLPSSGGSSNSLDAADGTPADAVFVNNDGLAGIGNLNASQELHLTVVDGNEAAISFTATQPLPLTQSTNEPNTAANIGPGNTAWTNPNGITASGGGSASVSTENGDDSFFLRASNFGFSIPPSATVTGVRVNYNRSLEDPNPLSSNIDGLQVRLTESGSSVRNDATTGSGFNSFGNSTDLWNVSLSPSIINNPNFGVDFRVVNQGTSDTDASISSVQVTVFYNPNLTTSTDYTAGVEQGTGQFKLSTGLDLSNPYVTILQNGRVGLNEPSPIFPLEVGTDANTGNGAHVTNGGTWTNGSSREWKSNFKTLNASEILQTLSELSITTWEYTGSNEGKHIGPIAEDFHEAFGLGNNNKYISTVDADGIALIAIQALEKENNELQKKNEELETRLEKLELLLLEK